MELVLWRVILILSTCCMPVLFFYVFWSSLHKSLRYTQYTYTSDQNESSKIFNKFCSVFLLKSCNNIIKTRFSLSKNKKKQKPPQLSNPQIDKCELFWGTKDEFHDHFWGFLAINLKNILWNRVTRSQKSCAEFVWLNFL